MTNHRLFGATAGLCVLLLMGTASAVASGLHFKSGPFFTVNTTDNTVEATGQVAGAGTWISSSITATYTFSVTCSNPGNDTGPVPGKTGSGTTPPSTPKVSGAIHGNALFDVTSTAVTTVNTAGLCPSKWTPHPGPITFTSATLTITSSNGGTLTQTYPLP